MSHKRYISFYLSIAIIFLSQSVNSRKEKDGILTDLNLEISTEFNDLPVSFAKAINVEFGATLNLADVLLEPRVQLDGLSGSAFTTLAMVDPDAPSRSNPIAKVWNLPIQCFYFETLLCVYIHQW